MKPTEKSDAELLLRAQHRKSYGYPAIGGYRTGEPATLYCMRCQVDWPCATMSRFEEG